MKSTYKKLWFSLGLALILVIGAFLLCFRNQYISDSIADWASFGAYVGGCFSLVSVILVCLTFIEQSKMSYKTQFESVFFDMLHTLRELKTDDISRTFSDIQEKVIVHFNSPFTPNDINPTESKEAIAYYFQLHNDSDIIHHYFRYLYHIVMYVCGDKSLNNKEKEKYVSLIQAQMSNDELLTTLFNVINYGNTSYIEVLDRYHLFENLRSVNELLDYIIITLFPKTTFKHLINPNNESDVIYDFDLDSLLHNDEQLFDTIERLKKEKLERQQSQP